VELLCFVGWGEGFYNLPLPGGLVYIHIALGVMNMHKRRVLKVGVYSRCGQDANRVMGR
jgi:hypothetical protein